MTSHEQARMKRDLILLISALVFVGVIFFLDAVGSRVPVACTTEAKLCSDGSAVGRTGPACEFAACPGEGQSDSSLGLVWISTTTPQAKYSFEYPDDFKRAYVHPVDFPPTITESSSPLTCRGGGTEVLRGGIAEMRSINGRSYCRVVTAEGAAGSTYREYAYSKSMWDRVVTLTFTTREPQCGNYDEPERLTCETEQRTFDADAIADRIFSTVKENVI